MELGCGIRATDGPVAVCRGGTGNPNVLAAPQGPAVTGNVFPRRTAQHSGAAIGPRLDYVGQGHRVNVMAQVAGGGEERRFTIFVAAVTGNRPQLCQRLADLRLAGPIERELEEAQVVLHMLAFPEARANNDTADR